MPARTVGGGFFEREFIRKGGDGFLRYHDILCPAAVVADSADLPRAAQNKISPRQASHRPQWPPCQPTPTRCPGFHAVTPDPTSSINPAISCPGMRGNWKPRPVSFFHKHVTVTNAAGLNLYPHPDQVSVGESRGRPAPIGPRSSRCIAFMRAIMVPFRIACWITGARCSPPPREDSSRCYRTILSRAIP